MPQKPKNVDQYLEIGCGGCKFGGTPQCKVHFWGKVLRPLQEILIEAGLLEEIKWGAPCYSHSGKKILVLNLFKESMVISFFRGWELDDSQNMLEKPSEHSRFRYFRFNGNENIKPLKPAILKFVREAIRLETCGKNTERSKGPELEKPEELIRAFEEDHGFESAFSSLTPGRQREYLLHFNSAKQSKTKSARIERSKPMIFNGKGLSEK